VRFKLISHICAAQNENNSAIQNMFESIIRLELELGTYMM
jgi:hypothetical protein